MKQKFSKLENAIAAIMLVLIMAIFASVGYIKAKYPIDYYDDIMASCKQFNVRPSLVAAVINAESEYNSTAVSNKGAVGLMQIMPSTAKFIAEELKIEDYNDLKLFNPSVNILFGTYYLSYLYEKYDSDEEVLFAYNAGEGVLNSIKSMNEKITIENIVIKETRNYITKVLEIEKIYNKIYKVF